MSAMISETVNGSFIGRRNGDYRAWPIISAKEPATRAAGTPAPKLTAPPVLVEATAEAVLEEDCERGVDVAEAETVAMLLLGVGVAVTALTRTRVLVIVVVAVDVESAAARLAAARQRKEVTKAPICMVADNRSFEVCRE